MGSCCGIRGLVCRCGDVCVCVLEPCPLLVCLCLQFVVVCVWRMF